MLNGITCIMFVLFVVNAAAMDSKDLTIPVVGLVISISWLLSFSYVNRDRLDF